MEILLVSAPDDELKSWRKNKQPRRLPPKPRSEPEAGWPFICISMRNLITAQHSEATAQCDATGAAALRYENTSGRQIKDGGGKETSAFTVFDSCLAASLPPRRVVFPTFRLTEDMFHESPNNSLPQVNVCNQRHAPGRLSKSCTSTLKTRCSDRRS